MAKPIKSRAPDVSVSDHAHQRWLERAAGRAPKKRTALAGMLERRLYNHLAGGIQARGLEGYIDMAAWHRAGAVTGVVRSLDDVKELLAGIG